MARTLPEQIVAAVTTLAEELAEWVVEGRDRDLAEHEGAVLARVRRALPRLLAAVVEQATSELAPRARRAARACPACGRKARPHQERRRQVLTTCGPVALARPWYHCGRCRRGWSALETTLAVERRARLSDGLGEWVVRLGAAAPFREAADLLAELTGLGLGAETIRGHTEAAGAALRAAEDAAVEEVERTREAAGAVDPAPGLLVVEADGAMLRYLDGWHEAKLGLVAGWEGGQLRASSYVAAREPAARFGARLAAEAARRGALAIERWEGGVTGRGLAVLRDVQVLGDGAAWIWHAADEHFGARIEAVDHWHAAEHLHGLAKLLHGDGPAARGPAPVLAALRAARPPTAEAAERLRRERGYFRANAERMDYPALRLDGLPLGSGAIESAADHLVQRRMKRAGMRWSDAGGDALLALRAHLASGRPLRTPRVPAA